MGIPSGWRDDGTHLMAPNGKSVVLRFRWHVLTHCWAPDDWPLESEHYEQLLDITNPELGGGIIQHFRKSILTWQEDSNQVLELWSGAVALAWQRRAWTDSDISAPSRPWLVAPPPNSMSAQRLACLENQVQMLITGLESGTRPNEVARAIHNQLDMVASDSLASKRPRHAFSSPRNLLCWLLILGGLLLGDTFAWAISSLIHRQTMLSFPLLALGTVALSACFYFLVTLRPLSKT